MTISPEDTKALAEAIRRGAARRPEQAYGEYYKGRRASCALGAAYEGLYRLPEMMEGEHPKDLFQYYECLDFQIRRCPEGCRKQLPLGALIVVAGVFLHPLLHRPAAKPECPEVLAVAESKSLD